MKLETRLKHKIRKSKVQKIILGSLYAAGMLSIAALAPNVLSALRYASGGTNPKNQKYTVNTAINRLKEKGLIKWEEGEYGFLLRLTAEGEEVLTAFEKRGFKRTGMPPKWDGRWRMVIFDIVERKRGIRDKFRMTLSEIGFLKLQESVWVYPYDCEELITLLKADFKIGKDILYVIADSIENDGWIKKHFDLD